MHRQATAAQIAHRAVVHGAAIEARDRGQVRAAVRAEVLRLCSEVAALLAADPDLERASALLDAAADAIPAGRYTAAQQWRWHEECEADDARAEAWAERQERRDR